MDFEKLYQIHYQELFCFAFKLCRFEDEAKDLVHDSFAKLFEESKKNSSIDNPRAWIYKVCLNIWRNRFNQNRTRGQIRDLILQRQTQTIQSTENTYIEREKRQMVFGLLDKMPEKERQLLYLYHEGLSYNEMAEVLDMNPKSVGKTLARAIHKFQSILKEQHYELFE